MWRATTISRLFCFCPDQNVTLIPNYIFKIFYIKFFFFISSNFNAEKKRNNKQHEVFHSFIHSFHFIFLIYSTVDIFVFISTIHLLFHAKQKYRTRELSYFYDHNARNLDSNSPYWCMLNTICLTHSIWKTSFITINGAQRHHFCFLAYMTWHTVRCYHCVQNIFNLLENSFFPFF